MSRGCAGQFPAPRLSNSVPSGRSDACAPRAPPLVPFGKLYPRGRESAFGLALLLLSSLETNSSNKSQRACAVHSDIEARWLKLCCSYEFAERLTDSQAED